MTSLPIRCAMNDAGPSEGYRHLKRVVDIALATTFLIALFPAMSVIYAAIVVSSGWPGLYAAPRIGLNGSVFTIYKFRTMHVGSDQGPGTTGKDDPRVTDIGRVLRRWKLDELPQLWNVLLGDMSIVGPRPELPEYVALYDARDHVALTVPPGLTDLSSIVFSDLQTVVEQDAPDKRYRQIVFPIKNKLRVAYARRQCLSLDMKILCWTVLAIFSDRARDSIASRVLREFGG